MTFVTHCGSVSDEEDRSNSISHNIEYQEAHDVKGGSPLSKHKRPNGLHNIFPDASKQHEQYQDKESRTLVKLLTLAWLRVLVMTKSLARILIATTV